MKTIKFGMLLILASACGESSSSGSSGHRELAPSDGLRYTEPRFAPNGEQLAVTVTYLNQERGEDIATIDVATGAINVVAEAGTYLAAPTWLPDGSAVIFTGDTGISKVPTAGGDAEIILDEAFQTFAAMEPDVSPDGSTLVYRINGGNLKQADIESKVIEDQGFSAFSPRYSPDGTSLAYVQSDSINIVTMNDTVSFETEFSLFPEIAWFPNGRKLAVTAKDGVAIYDLDSNSLELLREEFAVYDIDVSSDGSTIVYTTVGYDGIQFIDAP